MQTRPSAHLQTEFRFDVLQVARRPRRNLPPGTADNTAHWPSQNFGAPNLGRYYFRPAMNYFDTSALIKQFVEEAGSRRVERLIAGEPELAACCVAYAEVHAGLVRRLRDGSLTKAAYERASSSFDSEWTAYLRLDLI